jgi:hypothetical protein
MQKLGRSLALREACSVSKLIAGGSEGKRASKLGGRGHHQAMMTARTVKAMMRTSWEWMLTLC